MVEKTKLIVGLGLAAGGAAGAYYLINKKRRCLNNSDGVSNERRHKESMIFNGNEFTERENETIEGGLLSIEKEKISDIIKAMSEQELRVALHHIPVGLMFDEIGARLVAHEQFAAHIQEALECLPK